MLDIVVKKKDTVVEFKELDVGEIFTGASDISVGNAYIKTYEVGEAGVNAVNLKTGALIHISKCERVAILNGTLTCERQ